MFVCQTRLQDIGVNLLKLLRGEFHRLFKRKDQFNSELRLRNAKFISELTKFKVGPPEMFLVFDVLHACMDEINQSFSVDVVCCVLETCGRWLYMKAESQLRLVAVLDRLLTLKKSNIHNAAHHAMIENAVFTCRPPDRATRPQAKKLPPMQQYVHKLIFLELSPSEKSVEDVLKKLRRLPWDAECFRFMISTLSNVHTINYPNLQSVARYHGFFFLSFFLSFSFSFLSCTPYVWCFLPTFVYLACRCCYFVSAWSLD